MPSTFAAAMRLPFTWRSTSRMCSRSIVFERRRRGRRRARGGRSAAHRAAPALALRGRTRRRARAPRAACRRRACRRARSTFFSSRTLPSQRALQQHALGAPASARESACASAAAHSRMNAAVRYGMSSRRSRSGGSDHLDDVEAVEQIAAEPARGDFGAQVAVGRRDHR